MNLSSLFIAEQGKEGVHSVSYLFIYLFFLPRLFDFDLNANESVVYKRGSEGGGERKTPAKSDRQNYTCHSTKQLNFHTAWPTVMITCFFSFLSFHWKIEKNKWQPLIHMCAMISSRNSVIIDNSITTMQEFFFSFPKTVTFW